MTCLLTNPDGFLYLAESVPEGTECVGQLISSDQITLLWQVFDPAFYDASAYQTFFNLGLALPILAYLASWAFQSLITFINDKTGG